MPRRYDPPPFVPPPVLTDADAATMGLDVALCHACGHPAYSHYYGGHEALILGTTQPGGPCHTADCTCPKMETPDAPPTHPE